MTTDLWLTLGIALAVPTLGWVIRVERRLSKQDQAYISIKELIESKFDNQEKRFDRLEDKLDGRQSRR